MHIMGASGENIYQGKLYITIKLVIDTQHDHNRHTRRFRSSSFLLSVSALGMDAAYAMSLMSLSYHLMSYHISLVVEKAYILEPTHHSITLAIKG